MGHVFKRGKYWYIDYYADGKRYRKSQGKLKKYAGLRLKEIELQIAREELKIPQDAAVDEFFENFSTYAEAHVKPKTVEKFKTVISLFEKFRASFHRINKLSKITPAFLESFKLYRSKKGCVLERDGIKKYDKALWENFWWLAKKLGIENVSIHTFRHTFASYLIMNGVDLVTVKELLEHRDITTTMRYAHLVPGHKHWAVNRICSVFSMGTI